MKVNLKILISKIVLYIIGLFILALGVAFSIKSGLGVSPVNSIPYVISLIFNIELRLSVIIIFSIFIILQILILKRDFKIYNLTQIIFSTIFGYFTGYTNKLITPIPVTNYLGSIVMLAISIFLIALGVSLYVSANLVNMPMEGLVIAINEEIAPNKTFPDIKMIVDTIVVIIAILLSFYFLKGLYGVREGTLISAIAVGAVMKPIRIGIKPIVKLFHGYDKLTY